MAVLVPSQNRLPRFYRLVVSKIAGEGQRPTRGLCVSWKTVAAADWSWTWRRYLSGTVDPAASFRRTAPAPIDIVIRIIRDPEGWIVSPRVAS